MKLRRWTLLPLAALFLFAPGCGGALVADDLREIDQLALVETLGIDRAGRLMTVTASTASGGGRVLLKASAVTISRGVREMQNFTEKKYIFYGHVKHLLVGEDAAADSLSRCMEYVERDGELRLDTGLFIVRSGTAEAAITATGGSGGESSTGDLLESLEKDVQLLSESYVFTCAEISEALAERNCALAAAVMLTEPENILDGGGTRTLRSAGFAVIADGRLCRWLDGDLARGACLLMDRTGGDVIEAPDGRGGWFAARLTGSGVRFRPEYADGRLKRLSVRVELRCNLDELQQPLDLYDAETIRAMEEGLAAVESWRVAEVVRISQELGADFCGIGERVRRASPLRFDGMRVPWDEQFPELEVQVETAAKLQRTYDTGLSPMRAGEGDAS